jgi:hypothetical protein
MKRLIFTAICAMVLVTGCATLGVSQDPNATATVATPNQVATNVAILKPYLDMALAEIGPALITYVNTKDDTAADKAIYWAQYAQGVSAAIATVKTVAPK